MADRPARIPSARTRKRVGGRAGLIPGRLSRGDLSYDPSTRGWAVASVSVLGSATAEDAGPLHPVMHRGLDCGE